MEMLIVNQSGSAYFSSASIVKCVCLSVWVWVDERKCPSQPVFRACTPCLAASAAPIVPPSICIEGITATCWVRKAWWQMVLQDKMMSRVEPRAPLPASLGATICSDHSPAFAQLCPWCKSFAVMFFWGFAFFFFFLNELLFGRDMGEVWAWLRKQMNMALESYTSKW